MKLLFINSLFFVGVLLGFGQAQAQNDQGKYHYRTVNLPASDVLFTSFYVNELNQAFVPVNGGIYLPMDSLWFIPPGQGYYLTSFAPNVRDTGFFAFANTTDSSLLFYLKSSKTGPIKRHCVIKLDKGIYNVIFANNTCFIWGNNGKTSKIGILLKDQIKWMISVTGIIRQVQINASSDIYFTLNNEIYNLGSRQTVLSARDPIYGFCFDQSGNLIISTARDIGIFRDGHLTMIANGLSGMLECQNNMIFVCSNSGRQMNILSKF